MRVGHERRILLIAHLALAPVALAALLLAIAGGFSLKAIWMVAATIALCAFGATHALRRQLVRRLRTTTTIIITLWLRAPVLEQPRNEEGRGDVLKIVMIEVDALADLMEAGKVDALEGAALLRTLLERIPCRDS